MGRRPRLLQKSATTTLTVAQHHALQVCEELDVPLHVVPLTEEYWEHVVGYSVREIRAGRTPNPDIMCNSRCVAILSFFIHHDAHRTRLSTESSLVHFTNTWKRIRSNMIASPLGTMQGCAAHPRALLLISRCSSCAHQTPSRTRRTFCHTSHSNSCSGSCFPSGH